ncbi:MAG: DUF1003 domain-containing protein [Alphaproteobacteria bacterium]|nr:DUF1003 domain-containing protein [Alphaproteobacteria bacterium]
MLSFQAVYTAPIIMMSLNRQADIDRLRINRGLSGEYPGRG